jgi:hypothetical protein
VASFYRIPFDPEEMLLDPFYAVEHADEAQLAEWDQQAAQVSALHRHEETVR